MKAGGFSRALGMLVIGWATVFGGCTEKTPCDPGQALQGGYCWPVDAGGEAGSPFGQTCKVDTDCVAPTGFCAIQPGASGFCTAEGCDQDPSICPSGWKCMDLTPLGLAKHICIPGS